MNKLGIVAVVVLALSGATPPPLEAQSRLGGFLDWIHELSGPRMTGINFSYIRDFSDGRFAGRVGGASRGEREGPDDIGMYSGQIQLDWFYGPLRSDRVKFGSGVGFAAHYFTSDAPSFWHWSIPIYPAEIIWHVVDKARHRFGMNVTMDLGVHAFPPFDSSDFGSLDTGVDTENWEFPFAALVGLQWVF